MSDIESRLKAIEIRNKRVEQDKAWETSWTRRLSIATFTYIIVASYLLIIDAPKPFLSALVPPLGFVLSTMVLKTIRLKWEK